MVRGINYGLADHFDGRFTYLQRLIVLCWQQTKKNAIIQIHYENAPSSFVPYEALVSLYLRAFAPLRKVLVESFFLGDFGESFKPALRIFGEIV